MHPTVAAAGLMLPGHQPASLTHLVGADGAPSLGVAALVVALIAAATVGGASLAGNDRHPRLWLGVGGGGLVVIGLAHLLPDAWDGARAAGLPGWLVPVVAVGSLLVAAGVGRLGCTCHADSRRLSGTTTAAALAIHRLLEGTAVAIAGPAVAVGLVIHALSEGMAVGALLRSRGRRLRPWLTAMCVAPVAGVAVGRAIPATGVAEPLVLALAAGILLEAARTSLWLATRERTPSRNPGVLGPIVAAMLSALVTFIAVQAVG